MRVLMTAVINTEAGSRAIQEGKISDMIERTMRQLQPEAVYFGPVDGRRAAFIVFDLKEASDIVPISESLYQQLGAEVSFIPVMTPDDLQAGFQKLGAADAGR